MSAQLVFLVFTFIFAVISSIIFKYFLNLRFKGDKSLFFIVIFIIFSVVITLNTLVMFDYFSEPETQATEFIFD